MMSATTETPPDIEHVVILVHGIESEGAWMQKVQAVLQSNRVRVAPTKFKDRFPVTRFLLPWDTSAGPVADIHRQYRAMKDAFPNAKISAIAHSFGTHALMRALAADHTMRLHRVVLCGAVVERGFNWGNISPQIGDASDRARFFVNDCGNKDVWPVLGRTFGWGYGNVGTYGVGFGLVTDRFHEGGHGLFFDPTFIKKYWKPFILNGQIVDGTAEQGEGIPSWVRFLAWSPLLTKCMAVAASLLIVAIVALVLWLVVEFFFLAPTYNPITLEQYHIEAMQAGTGGPVAIKALDGDVRGDLVHWTGTVIEVDPTTEAYKIVFSDRADGPAKIWASFADGPDFKASTVLGTTKEFTGLVQEVNNIGTIVEQCRSGDRTSWWSRVWCW